MVGDTGRLVYWLQLWLRRESFNLQKKNHSQQMSHHEEFRNPANFRTRTEVNADLRFRPVADITLQNCPVARKCALLYF
jgi:hypothetical protein